VIDHRIVARAALALFSAALGASTLIIDLNRTHATNPRWPGHARFHLVWQNLSAALFSISAIALVLCPGPSNDQRFYFAALINCIPMLAFIGALASRKRYDGALSDPNGIPPAQVVIFGKALQFDLNLVAVIAGFLVLGTVLVIYLW
jgi:hypothetical protein